MACSTIEVISKAAGSMRIVLTLTPWPANRAEVAEPRPFVGRRIILAEEAIARNADAGDDGDVGLFISRFVGRAFDETVAGDHRHDLLVVDELGRRLGGLLRLPGVVLEGIVDRPAVDSAIGVDAFEIGRRRVARRAEVGRTGPPDDAADRDRLSRRLLAIVQAADRLGGRGGARGCDGRKPQQRRH
jgi:hypothetical protein